MLTCSTQQGNLDYDEWAPGVTGCPGLNYPKYSAARNLATTSAATCMPVTNGPGGPAAGISMKIDCSSSTVSSSGDAADSSTAQPSPDSCASVSCGAHGSCSNGNCVCESGYGGSACQFEVPVGSSCHCICCVGTPDCTAQDQGFVTVSTCPSSCASDCRTSFAACPAAGTSGKLTAGCVTHSANAGSQTSDSSLAVAGVLLVAGYSAMQCS